MFSITQKIAFIESVFGKGEISRNNVNFYVRCPICAPEKITKKKLAIRVTDDAHHCWTCGWKSYSLAPLIKKFGSREQLAEYRKLFKANDKEISRHDDETANEVKLPSDFRLLVESPLTHPDVKAAWNYLKSRGITAKDAWYFRLGLSNEPQWYRRIICPSFDEEGHVNFFVARNIDPNDKRCKYDNPRIDRSKIVFNEMNIDWSDPLVICEGFIDLIKCPDNSTALLSSDFSFNSRLFSQIAMNDTPVILALDTDMINTKIPKLYKHLQYFDIDVKIADFGSFKDPGETSKKECRTIISKAKSLSWEQSFFSKLESLNNTSLSIKV